MGSTWKSNPKYLEKSVRQMRKRKREKEPHQGRCKLATSTAQEDIKIAFPIFEYKIEKVI
jgi:hypothetical protein